MQHELLIVGMNHRTAPVSLRERVAFSDDQLDDANQRLRSFDGIEESTIVCTCNRVEVVAIVQDVEGALKRITDFLRREEHHEHPELEEHLYVCRGSDAVRHLFRVAASLDSMVVGEPQILGQLKGAYARAASVGATGAILHRFFHKGFSAAKRVRTETGIAGRAVSVSSAAVELAAQIFDTLAGKTTMLIGAGKMGELAARHLLGHGATGLLVTNRTFDRAVDLAREFSGTPVPFDAFPKYLPMADIVIGATGATDFLLTVPLVTEALKERKGRPIFLIDLSVPRNFDPRVNELDNVYLYDVDDLATVATENLQERAAEAQKAEEIVASEVESFCRWLEQLQVVPTIVALRKKAETIRRFELDKTLNRLRELSPSERAALEALTSAIVNKLLHAPITRLKDQNHRSEAFYVDAMRRLFNLEESDES